LIGGPFTQQQIGERLQKELDSDVRWGVQYWPIFERSTGQFVGCCGLSPRRPEERVLEVGFHLLPKHWGKGLAGEAAQTVIRFAFEQIGAKALFAGHHPANAASRRLLQRLGFTYTHSEIYPPTGLEHPSYMLQASDFAMVSGA
jgi:RimJ/RimL family protein N-acetyltransferase